MEHRSLLKIITWSASLGPKSWIQVRGKTNFLDKYERKGRLMKKSMTTDKFKER